MEISGQALEAAAQSMYHGTLAQQQEAANFFSSWQNSSNALISSVQFLSLSTNSSDALQFVTCCVILYASDQWFKYDRNMLNEIRTMMLQYTFTKPHNPIINGKLDEIIAKMGFNDWPEQWENFIPQLQSYIKYDNSDNDFNSLTHIFMILSYFLDLMSNSPKISLKRRAMMIDLFIKFIPSIIQNSNIQISNELSDNILLYKLNSSNIQNFPTSVVNAFLEFAKSLCAIIGNNASMSISFSTYMFVTFANIIQYSEKSLDAISRLLSPSSYLTHLIPYMTRLILSNETEGVPISPALHEFICIFLIKFLNIADSYITTEEIAQLIQKLFQVSLNSASQEKFCQHFWSLWHECLNQISKGSLKSISTLLSPLFPLIIQIFYSLLPCSMQLSRLISPLTSSSFQSLMKISPDNIINFINSQHPSISQCISIGIIQHPSFLPKILQLIKECTNLNNISVFSSLLYMISRNISLLKTNPDLISALHQLSFTYLLNSTDSDYHTSVLFALNHVASSFPNALTSSSEFLNLLFKCASSSSLQEEDFSRLCRILAKVIMTTPQEARAAYIKRLTDLASVPLCSTDMTAVSIGAQAAWAISSISICGSYLITKYLWSPLLVAMEHCAQQQNDKQSSNFADIVAVFASSVRSAPFGHCRKVILRFISIAQQYVNAHSEWATPVLDAYNLMFQCHCELIDFRDEFATTFVRGMAESPHASFFEFFSIAGLKEEERKIVVSAACTSIKDPDLDISKSAAHLLKTLVNRQKDEAFLVDWQGLIISAVFQALFDDLHKPALQQISKVLFAIYKQHIKRKSLSQEVDKIVIQAIVALVGDQAVTVSFAAALRNAASSKVDFLALIHDFLIAFGRLNPVEMKIFDDTLAVDSLAHDIGKASIQGSEAAIKNEDEYALNCI